MRFERRALLTPWLCVLALLVAAWGSVGAFAAPMTDGAVQVKSELPVPDGMQVVLSIAPPTLELTQAKDGNTYTKVTLAGCGNDNDFGRPSLPIITHTVEVPLHAEAEVTLTGEVWHEIAVARWVYPHQPPVPKVPGPEGDPPFVIDTAYYTGAKSIGTQKAYGGQKSVVAAPFKKRGRQYLDIQIRPLSYDVSKGIVQYPSEVQLNIAWTVNPLPKAAGPRAGVITVVNVTLTDTSQLDELVKDGFDISGRKGDVVTIYATAAELEALRQKGLKIEIGGQQPGPKKAPSDEKGLGAYHTYVTLTADLEAYAAAHPSICRLVSIGKSVQNRDLWAMKITDNPDVEEDEPELKYVGSIHGDEPLAAEMCLYFIDYLVGNYGTIPRVANLVNENEIWVLPVMNPDGYEADTRYNYNSIDLNRSFPEGAENAIGNVLYGPAMNTAGRPIEVVDMMQWTAAHRFVLSANFHGGALLTNYPYDNDGLGSVNSPCPDDALFVAISEAYASQNAPMWNSTSFVHGITNGAAWYCIDGGMQDWNYRYAGCNEVTIELSDIKQPSASLLAQFWNENREAMLAYFETINTGIRGIVTDGETGLPLSASVMVVGTNHLVFTDPDVGDYHRQLLPGTYNVIIRAPGYRARTIEGVSVEDGSTTRLDVPLQRGEAAGVIVVSSASMALDAGRFRSEKQAEGFEVYDVTVSSSSSAETVRGQIRTVYDAYQPQYVIILGDIEIVPTFTSGDGYASDLPYALMDLGESFNNYRGKDLVVGRVSLKTGAAIGAYTNKLMAYAGNVKHGDLTWVSGGSTTSENNIAENTHNWVIANTLPEGYHNQLFYRNDGSTGATLTAYINSGTDGIIYSGHGATTYWARYTYNATNLAGLTNSLDTPMVFAHCCITGSFAESVCFAESWLQTTGRGIVYIGASANTYWDEDDVLEKQEFHAMQDTPGLTVGDALAAGLDQVYASYPSSAQYYYTVYQNFGDPTLMLFGPGGLTITTAGELPLAYAGEAVNIPISAVNGEWPYTWSLVGTLPDGLTFDTAAHAITGTPTAAGTADFAIQITDHAGTTVSHSFHLIIVSRLSIVSPMVLPSARLNQPYSYSLETTGGTSPMSWSVAELTSYAENDVTAGWVGGGTAQYLLADDLSTSLALPWAFSFYGKDYTSVNVCSNGYLNFTSASAMFMNTEYGLRMSVMIAPLWDDLITGNGVEDVYVTQTADYVIVRWEARTVSGGYPVNVEAVLCRDGRIQFNYYGDMYGLSPTIGISAGDGTHYMLASMDGFEIIPEMVSVLFIPDPVLPPGIALSPGGVLSGTPTQIGEYQFLLRTRDTGTPQQTAERQFQLTVHEFMFEWLEKPTDAWKEVGMPLLLRVRCAGTLGDVHYQWTKDGGSIPDATHNELSIASLKEADEGLYSCIVTDESKGVYTFDPVSIRVFPAGSLPVAGVGGLSLAILALLGAGARSFRRKQ